MRFKISRRLLKVPLYLILLTQCHLAWAAASCTITIVALSFGAIVTSGPNIDSDSGSVNVSCMGTLADNPLMITTRLSPGVNSASYAARKLQFGVHTLNYNLYLSPNRLPSSVWGDGTNSTEESHELIDSFNGNGVPRTKTLVVYGRVFGNQGLKPAGLYTDSIVVSVTF